MLLVLCVALWLLAEGLFGSFVFYVVFGESRLAFITQTRLYNFDPLKPLLYIVKMGFTGVYIIFLISFKKHRM